MGSLKAVDNYFIGGSVSGAGSVERPQPSSDPRVPDTFSEASANSRTISRTSDKPITIQRAKLTRGKTDEYKRVELLRQVKVTSEIIEHISLHLSTFILNGGVHYVAFAFAYMCVRI